MKHRPLVFMAIVALCAAARAQQPEPAEKPVPRTHAHNDYEHPHPLLDALHEGFVGVEADVYLVGNELRVAHDKAEDWSKVPTLEAAYLDPLVELAARRGGHVYADGTRLLLLVDIKTEAMSTYRRLHEVFDQYQAKHPGLFSSYVIRFDGDWDVIPGAVDVVISGNSPGKVIATQGRRYAGIDGRPGKIGAGATAGLVPLVSENWNVVFTGAAKWDGTGEMPAATRAKLRELVDTAHREKRQLRFWNLPVDGPAVWGPLYDAGVDLINTDDLSGLARFVRERAGVGNRRTSDSDMPSPLPSPGGRGR